MKCEACFETIDKKAGRPVIAYSGEAPNAQPHPYHRRCWRAGVVPGVTVRIKAGYVGAGYRFVVKSLYDNTAAPVDPCVQVYGENYGPVRLTEVEVA